MRGVAILAWLLVEDGRVRYVDDNSHSVMHHAGRIRIAVHGHNIGEDVERLPECLVNVSPERLFRVSGT